MPASVRFDYFPRGTPFITYDAIEAVMDASLEAGDETDDTIAKIREEEIRELRRNPAFAEALHDAFAASGVTLVSPTLGRASLNNPVTHEAVVRNEAARWQARIDHLDWMHKAPTPAAAREIAERGELGVAFNVQNLGAEVFDSPSVLETLYNYGVRITQLTYNTQNLLGSSSMERVDAGLTDHGLDVVDRLNDLGCMIDLSHSGPRTTLDAAERSRAPVAATHTMCGALVDHERAKSDEEIEALAASDGYMGLILKPSFLSPGRADQVVDAFVDHVEHLESIIGVERIGIGSDWGRWTLEVPEKLRPSMAAFYRQMGDERSNTGVSFGAMERYAEWDFIPELLAERGYSESEIRGITGENFVAFWERVAAAA